MYRWNSPHIFNSIGPGMMYTALVEGHLDIYNWLIDGYVSFARDNFALEDVTGIIDNTFDTFLSAYLTTPGLITPDGLQAVLATLNSYSDEVEGWKVHIRDALQEDGYDELAALVQ